MYFILLYCIACVARYGILYSATRHAIMVEIEIRKCIHRERERKILSLFKVV